MTPFERYLFKLSENQKIVEIEFTEFKLWQLSEPLNEQGIGVHVVKYLSTAVTLVSLIQFQQFYAFLKADNSNYMFLVGPYMCMYMLVARPCYHNRAHLSG